MLLLVLGILELCLLACITVAWASGFVVTTALVASIVEAPTLRLALGLALTVVVPLYWYARLRRRSRAVARAPLRFVALVSAAGAIALSLGFADDVGRALRRHGDWFLGERNGAVARMLRASVTLVAERLERFDPPHELDPVVLPANYDNVPLGPYLPGQEPPPPEPQVVAWIHPLPGASRAMPGNESRRFGAVRPQPRPSECQLGHCGVDLGHTFGAAVVAIGDGVIERIERDEGSGGRAGRYVRIGHKGGTMVSRYVHLDSIRADLQEGQPIRGGELIGRLGLTGIEHSGAHLHFALSIRPSGKATAHAPNEKYVDPEPQLARWRVIETPVPPTVALASTRVPSYRPPGGT